jgi:hypothetical protein
VLSQRCLCTDGTGLRSLHEPLRDYRAENSEDGALRLGQRGRGLRARPSLSFRDGRHHWLRPAETHGWHLGLSLQRCRVADEYRPGALD